MTAWDDGNCLMRLSVGKDAPTVTARRLQKEAELNAMNNGLAIMPESGGGFTHGNMSRALGLGSCDPWLSHNTCSDYIAAKCFPNN
jgi:hypothetical protein